MYDFRLTDELKVKIKKIIKKDKKKVEIINKKIKEIINNDSITINRYKNLKYELKDLKRVHIDKHFVLVFNVENKNNLIRFINFDHHDNIY